MKMTGDDIFAGSFLLCFGLVGIILHLIIVASMWSLSKKIVGFRFLISQSLVDMLLLIQFAIWPGFVIIWKWTPVSSDRGRLWMHIYLDTIFLCMCYHYVLIGWSRFVAVGRPLFFRTQLTPSHCILLCTAICLLSLAHSLIIHSFSWFAVFFYDPTTYGMTADWRKYSTEGTQLYYQTVSAVFSVLPLAFYVAALSALYRQRNSISPVVRRNPVHSMWVERRLLLPCLINTFMFISGQIAINVGVAEGKWVAWSVMLIFAANSFVNPLLLFIFSSVVRKRLFQLFSAKSHPVIALH